MQKKQLGLLVGLLLLLVVMGGNRTASASGPNTLADHLRRLEEHLSQRQLNPLRKELTATQKALLISPMASPQRHLELDATLRCMGVYLAELDWGVHVRFGPPLAFFGDDFVRWQRWLRRSAEQVQRLRQTQQECLRSVWAPGGMAPFLRSLVTRSKHQPRINELIALQAWLHTRTQYLHTLQRSAAAIGPSEKLPPVLYDTLQRERTQLRQKLVVNSFDMKELWPTLQQMLNSLPQLPQRPVLLNSPWPRITTISFGLIVMAAAPLSLAFTDKNSLQETFLWGGLGGALSILTSLPAAMTWEMPSTGLAVAGGVSMALTALLGALAIGLAQADIVRAFGLAVLLGLPVHLVWNIGGWVQMAKKHAIHRTWQRYTQSAILPPLGQPQAAILPPVGQP